MKTLHHFMLVAFMLSSISLASIAFLSGPARAQQASPRWTPRVESIIVKAGAMKNWHMALTASHLGKAFAVSATIPSRTPSRLFKTSVAGMRSKE